MRGEGSGEQLHVQDKLFHEMLRKTRYGNTTKRQSDTTQSSPQQPLFIEQLAASGGIGTHDTHI